MLNGLTSRAGQSLTIALGRTQSNAAIAGLLTMVKLRTSALLLQPEGNGMGSYRRRSECGLAIVSAASACLALSVLAGGVKAQGLAKLEIAPATGHSQSVHAVAFSFDRTRVLSGSADKTAMLWDAETGRLLRSFEGHLEAITAVAISPDGARVLSGSVDRTTRLWDVATGRVLHAFEGPDTVVSVGFSPNGARAVTVDSQRKTVKLWDVVTDRLLRSWSASRVLSVALSMDGSRVLAGSKDGTVRLWDAATGRLLHTFAGSRWVHSVALSPDGSRALSANIDGRADLWDTASGRLLRTFDRHAK